MARGRSGAASSSATGRFRKPSSAGTPSAEDPGTRRLLADPDRLGTAEHWQFSGASLALTAETYARVGGLEPRATLEDEGLEQILREQSIPIERLLSVRATTSSRLEGRASQGLAHDLAAAASRLDDATRPSSSGGSRKG